MDVHNEILFLHKYTSLCLPWNIVLNMKFFYCKMHLINRKLSQETNSNLLWHLNDRLMWRSMWKRCQINKFFINSSTNLNERVITRKRYYKQARINKQIRTVERKNQIKQIEKTQIWLKVVCRTWKPANTIISFFACKQSLHTSEGQTQAKHEQQKLQAQIFI